MDDKVMKFNYDELEPPKNKRWRMKKETKCRLKIAHIITLKEFGMVQEVGSAENQNY